MLTPAPNKRRYTPYVALHLIRRAAPVTLRCTRYVALHPIRRGVMPTDRVHRRPQQACTWVISLAPPTPTLNRPKPRSAGKSPQGKRFFAGSITPVREHYTTSELV